MDLIDAQRTLAMGQVFVVKKIAAVVHMLDPNAAAVSYVVNASVQYALR